MTRVVKHMIIHFFCFFEDVEKSAFVVLGQWWTGRGTASKVAPCFEVKRWKNRS